MRMVAPNGAVIDAADDAVKRLVDAGFSPEEPAAKPKPQRRKAAKTTEKKETDKE